MPSSLVVHAFHCPHKYHWSPSPDICRRLPRLSRPATSDRTFNPDFGSTNDVSTDAALWTEPGTYILPLRKVQPHYNLARDIRTGTHERGQDIHRANIEFQKELGTLEDTCRLFWVQENLSSRLADRLQRGEWGDQVALFPTERDFLVPDIDAEAAAPEKIQKRPVCNSRLSEVRALQLLREVFCSFSLALEEGQSLDSFVGGVGAELDYIDHPNRA
ncbi:hypothetical protein ACJZ2D_002037 [Fusarium nematophilum]